MHSSLFFRHELQCGVLCSFLGRAAARALKSIWKQVHEAEAGPGASTRDGRVPRLGVGTEGQGNRRAACGWRVPRETEHTCRSAR